MQIKLRKLEIENFKGCKNLSISFGDVTTIFGDNDVGKSTISDAWNWLLFGKDSIGRTDFKVRTLDKTGKPINYIEIRVVGVMVVDGKEITLSKVQKQDWVTRRGTDISELKGNKNFFEVNEIPTSESEYKRYIGEMMDEKLFRLITSSTTFAGQPWKEQRAELLKLVSEVTDIDVVESDAEKFGGLNTLLADFTPEQLTSKAAKALKELKARQKEIPARIDEVSKSVTEVDVAELELQKKNLQDQIAEVESQEIDAEAPRKEYDRISTEIIQTKAGMSAVETKANEGIVAERKKLQKKYDIVQEEVFRLFSSRQDAEHELKSNQEKMEWISKVQAELKTQYQEISAESFPEESLQCPACGQELPVERKEELFSQHQKARQERLNRLIEEGSKNKARIKTITDEIARLEKCVEELKSAWTEKTSKKDELYTLLQQDVQYADMSENQEYQTLQDKLSDLEGALGNMSTGTGLREQLRNRRKELGGVLAEINSKLAKSDSNERAKERIAELHVEQKEVGQKVADQEKQLFLLEQFIRAKMDLLSEKINGKFRLVNFNLFETQINGGIKETCECTINGVPYADLNTSGKVKAGLDIIRTLSEMYGVSAPVFIDNRESITTIPEMNTQIINLVVSEKDKELRVEVD